MTHIMNYLSFMGVNWHLQAKRFEIQTACVGVHEVFAHRQSAHLTSISIHINTYLAVLKLTPIARSNIVAITTYSSSCPLNFIERITHVPSSEISGSGIFIAKIRHRGALT